MRVVVKFHRVTRSDLDEWVLRLSQTPRGNPEIARFMRDELVRQLEASEGLPSEAAYLAGHEPPCWVWQFNADTWVLYKWKDRDLGFWRGRERKVVIIGLATTRPG